MEDGSDSDHDQTEQSVDNVSQEKSDVPQKPLTGKELLLQKFNALKSLKVAPFLLLFLFVSVSSYLIRWSYGWRLDIAQ
jgi:hypothetical protein